MAIAVTVNDVQDSGDRFWVIGTFVVSGAYVQVTGDTVNFSKATMAKLAVSLAGIPSSEAPISCSCTTRGSGIAPGYNPGASRDTGFLRFFTTYNSELAAGTYTPPILGETIDFEACFRKLI